MTQSLIICSHLYKRPNITMYMPIVLLLLLGLNLNHVTTQCTDPCTLPSGQRGFCFENKCLSYVDEEQKQNLTFAIMVKYSEAQLKSRGRTGLHIRGNSLGLLWSIGKQLVKIGKDTWAINITYKSSPGGFQCQSCPDMGYLPDNKLQYRIMVDDFEDMLGANFAIKFPISQTSSYFDTIPNYISYPWFYEHTGDLQTFVIESKYIGERRNVTIYTPPSFHENSYKTYPAILVFDLSLEFATFLKRNFEGPIIPYGQSDEYILIGFGDYKKNGTERTDLLTPRPGPSIECINGTFGDNCDGCIPVEVKDNVTEVMRYLRNLCGKISVIGGRGDDTLDFLIKEALPVAKQKLNARLLNDNLGVMGYSLGGLMACYAAWTRPHVFSFGACQSPSFWWPYSNASLDAVEFDFLNKTLTDPIFQRNRTNQRIYLDAGGAETTDPYRLTQSVVETGRLLKSFKQFKINDNLWVAVDPMKSHHFVEWAKRVRQALAALLPAMGASGMPTAQAPLVG